jgi:hypothetical protein
VRHSFLPARIPLSTFWSCRQECVQQRGGPLFTTALRFSSATRFPHYVRSAEPALPGPEAVTTRRRHLRVLSQTERRLIPLRELADMTRASTLRANRFVQRSIHRARAASLARGCLRAAALVPPSLLAQDPTDDERNSHQIQGREHGDCDGHLRL